MGGGGASGWIVCLCGGAETRKVEGVKIMCLCMEVVCQDCLTALVRGANYVNML